MNQVVSKKLPTFWKVSPAEKLNPFHKHSSALTCHMKMTIETFVFNDYSLFTIRSEDYPIMFDFNPLPNNNNIWPLCCRLL